MADATNNSQYIWILGIVSVLLGPLVANQVMTGPDAADSRKPKKTAEIEKDASSEKGENGTDSTKAANDELENLLWQALEGKKRPRLIDGEIQKMNLDFVIATASDPINSRNPVEFDQTIEALELAASRMGYVHDRYSFPWPRSVKARRNRQGQALDKQHQLGYSEHTGFQGQPGILLFRRALKREDKPPKADAGIEGTATRGIQKRAEYIVVLLVAETPTTGIDTKAFQTALNWCWERQYQRGTHTGSLTFRVLGPRYSGSQKSLQQAILAWKAVHAATIGDRQVVFDVISGTASAVNANWFQYPSDAPRAGNRPTDPDPQLRIRFSATCQQSDDLRRHLDDYVKETHRQGVFRLTKVRVAWLVEANTGFGMSAAKYSSHPKEKKQAEENEPVEESIMFPLHIAQVYQTYKKQGLFNDRVTALSEQFHQGIDLPTNAIDGATDVTPDYEEGMSAVYADLELARIMRTIASGDFDYIGIVATDVRDSVFLAQMISKHCPDVRLMAVSNDLQYLHPEVLPYTTGMLIATTYPLISKNQTWSFPHQGRSHQVTLASDEEVGIYNAFMLLVNSKLADNESPAGDVLRKMKSDKAALLLEYGSPLDPDTFHSTQGQAKDLHVAAPAAWIVMASQAGFVPVKSWRGTPADADQENSKDRKAAQPKRADPNLANPKQDYVAQVRVNLATDDRDLLEGEDVESLVLDEWHYTTGLTLGTDWVILSTLTLLTLGAAVSTRRQKAVHAFSRSVLPYQGARVALLASIASFLLAPVARCFADYHHWPHNSDGRRFVLCLGGALTALLPCVACGLWWKWRRNDHSKETRKAPEKKSEPAKFSERPWADRLPVYLALLSAFLLVIAVLRCFVVFDPGADAIPNTGIWKHFPGIGDRPETEPVFAIFRSAAMFSGVCITWPVLALFAALAIWLWDCESRQRLVSDQIVCWPFSNAVASAGATGATLAAFRRLDECRKTMDLRCRAGWETLWDRNRTWCIIVLVVWSFCAMLIYGQATPTGESFIVDLVIYFTAGALFFVGAIRCLAFIYGWKDLARLLEWLAMLPIGSAFDRLPKGFSQRMGFYLDAQRARTSHQFFAADVADKLMEIEVEKPAKIKKSVRTVFVADQKNPDQLNDVAIEENLAEICSGVVKALARTGGIWQAHAAPRKEARAADKANPETPREISAALQWPDVVEQLQVVFSKKNESQQDDSQWQDLAEQLLAIQIVRYVNYYLASLRKLCIATVAILLLLLVGVTAYPLQPQTGLAIGVFGLAGGAAVIVARVLVQMDKNEVLSRLNKTAPNEISWDKGFIMQLATLLGPFALVLFVQIPGIGHFVRSILDPVLRTFTVTH